MLLLVQGHHLETPLASISNDHFIWEEWIPQKQFPAMLEHEKALLGVLLR